MVVLIAISSQDDFPVSHTAPYGVIVDCFRTLLALLFDG
jgi:hypothetical protein